MAHSEAPASDNEAVAILTDLVACTELNMDDLEEETRRVLAQAHALLTARRRHLTP